MTGCDHPVKPLLKSRIANFRRLARSARGDLALFFSKSLEYWTMCTRTRLFASTLFTLAVITVPGIALAQEPPGTEVEELIITGSRIARPNLEQPTPVSTINETAIENSGSVNLGDVIAQIPALSSSGTVRANSDSGANLGGLSFPDLRSLGTSRTLTLVNGKRHVGGDAGDTAVDLSTIPISLVDRVEVVTGGASAIYGSDAVTGVINVILKDDFDGIEFGAQTGGPFNGSYGQSSSAYLTAGKTFADDRANATLTLFWDRQDQVRGPDIEGLADWATIENPADTGPTDGIPDRLYRPYVQTEYFSNNGNLVSAFTNTPVSGFDVNGNPLPIPPRIGSNNLYYGAFAEPCNVCVSTDADAVLVPDIERFGVAVTSRWDLTDRVRLRTDLKYVNASIYDTFGASFSVFEYALVPDNAFITPQIQAVLDQYPGDAFFLNRVNADIGGRNDDTRRQTIRSVTSLEGDFDAGFSDLNWELAYNYGRTQNRFVSSGGLIPGNYNSAIDAVVDPVTNTIKCRRDVPSAYYVGDPIFGDYEPIPADELTGETCVPFNMFGAQNSQAAIDYVSFESERTHTITQQVGSLVFDGDTQKFWNLPGGPLAFAGGFEWRRERSKNINDPFVQSGITESAPQPNAIGGFEVKEAFAEFDAPILRDQPWAHRLSLNAAIRYADYSHAGEATSSKAGFLYAPVKDLTFRGTVSRATRAPNITEAFLPATAGFNSVFDPCDQNSIDEDPDRIANCAALGVTFDDATDNQFPGVTSGNANLKSEKADTWTVGAIFQPRWLPGLAVTVDYYNIEIENAISFLDPQDAADKCVDGPELAVEYCNLIIRDPATAQIQSYVSSFLNQASLETDGYDIQVTYSRNIGPGRLTSSISANYIEHLRQYAFQDFPDEVDIEEGEVGDPRWSFITSHTWEQGPYALTLESNYIDRVRRDRDTSIERSDRPYIPSQWYHDIIGRYRLDRGEGYELFVGINNVFDKTIPIGLTGNTGPTASYDIYGRSYFAGVKARF